jgi:uncharacterized phage protein gp47/JayE
MPTKEEIMGRMLSAISNDYDKSEGSFIYDAVAAIATALEDGYIELDNILDKTFVDTAYDEYLDKITEKMGIYRKPSTKATTNLTITGTNGTVIPIGARFFVDSVYFTSTESKTITSGSASVLVECETPGTIGNVPANSIVNYEPISGVTSVTNLNPVTNGTDTETNEELREIYTEQVRTPATSGNVQHYINWCREVVGVGDAKILPLWNGNGTVKCVIVNGNKRAADNTLVNLVTTNVEGKRPIGATVTVVSATELPINISVDIDVLPDLDLTTLQEDIIQTLEDYFQVIAFKSEYISYALVGSKILSVPGVMDYRNLTLNGGTASVTVGNTQVAVVGTVNVT